MRAWIAYIFLMIFSFQIVPVKEIGEILFKGQITEEEVHGYGHSTDDTQQAKLKKEGDPYHSSDNLRLARIIHFAQETQTLLHNHSVFLPAFHVPDVFTPPPNCA